MALNQRWMTWSLAAGAFVVTLGVSAWHEGLWSAAEPVAQHADAPPTSVTAPTSASPTDLAQMTARPFGPTSGALRSAALPSATAPSTTARTAVSPAPVALAAATPPSPEAPEISNGEPQTEPYNTPAVDNGEMQALRDRAAAHSSRSH